MLIFLKYRFTKDALYSLYLTALQLIIAILPRICPVNMRVLYMHLLSTPTLVPGQQVKKGDRIGTIGSTGNSTGPHLHFGLFVGDDARMAPSVKGWTSIKLLPVVDPINALPLYHVDVS